MQYNKRTRWMLCFIVAAAVCCNTQMRLSAQNADTFISKECRTYCEEAGSRYGICPELLEAIMESESSGNPKAENGNCKGLMQINMKYHGDRMKRLGVSDIYDSRGNVTLAADYLAELFAQYGDIGTVLMVYNGSSDALERGARGDYTEYALKIMERSEQLERLHGK